MGYEYSNRHTVQRTVQCAFKDLMTHEFCKSRYISQFAAFFIVAGAKRSIAKSILKAFFIKCQTYGSQSSVIIINSGF